MCASFLVAVVGVILLAVACVVCSSRCLAAVYDFFVFNKNSAFWTLSIGGGWFLWNVLHLSLADFGEYRNVLFVTFGTILLMSFIWLRELLAIRGLAVLCLMASNAILWAVYTELIFGKIILVSFVYVVVLLSMMVGSVPYLWRDAVNYLIKHSAVRYFVSFVVCAIGILFVVMPFIPIRK